MRPVVCVTQFARESTKSIATPPSWDATPTWMGYYSLSPSREASPSKAYLSAFY